jgi:hypothetical protein
VEPRDPDYTELDKGHGFSPSDQLCRPEGFNATESYGSDSEMLLTLSAQHIIATAKWSRPRSGVNRRRA